ncbi:hypothetical protein PWT90_04845 [Aphanocladium album]|nr:hypothetical protein PWT90_04845 [Aphanocladium album]
MDSSSVASASLPSTPTLQTRPFPELGQVMYMNAVYFHNSHIARDETPAKLDYGFINLVYYAYASVAPDGIVNLGDEWADIRAPVDGVEGGLGSLMQLKQRYRHLKVLLSIGGPAASGVFVSIASNPATRNNFAYTAAGLVVASGLDGVDISWHVPADPVQGANFLALAQAVRSKLQGGRMLTAALPANPAVLQHIDLAVAAESLDFINLQTYNLHHAQPGRSLCPSQLYSMAKDEPSTSTVAGYILSRNFPAQKLLLGIPTFGTSFPGCDGPGQAYDPAESQSMDYLGLPVAGRQEGIDRRRISAYCAGGPEGFIAYDNPDTVKEKADFCKQKGFGWTTPKGASDDATPEHWPRCVWGASARSSRCSLACVVTARADKIAAPDLASQQAMATSSADADAASRTSLSPPRNPTAGATETTDTQKRRGVVQQLSAADCSVGDDSGAVTSSIAFGGSVPVAAAASAEHISSSETEQQPPPPPPFEPLFALLTNTTTGATVHPRIHYIFSDDDTSIPTDTAAHQHGDADEHRSLVVALQPPDDHNDGAESNEIHDPGALRSGSASQSQDTTIPTTSAA